MRRVGRVRMKLSVSAVRSDTLMEKTVLEAVHKGLTALTQSSNASHATPNAPPARTRPLSAQPATNPTSCSELPVSTPVPITPTTHKISHACRASRRARSARLKMSASHAPEGICLIRPASLTVPAATIEMWATVDATCVRTIA
jgi:hypothetical protein